MGSSFLSESRCLRSGGGSPSHYHYPLLPTLPPGHSSAQRLSRQRFSALAHFFRSRQCSDLVCFLGLFCRVAKIVGRRTLVISVLHTWGSAMTHHPHVHMIVPGGSCLAH